ncbi:MAG TPA: SRPBCC family protein [Thiothrix sp.]|nr:SRPBCC family protein [Thiothrix sp.]
MIYVYSVLVILGGLFVLWWLIGVMMPRDVEVTRKIFIKAPIEDVWAAMTDATGQISWRSDLQRVEIKSTEEGGDVWVEVSKVGKRVMFKTLYLKAPLAFQLELRLGSFMTAYREGELVKNQSGTNLRIKEVNRVSNPLYRPLVRWKFNLDKVLDQYQHDLKRYLGG